MRDALERVEDPSQFTVAKLNGKWNKVVNGNDYEVQTNYKALKNVLKTNPQLPLQKKYLINLQNKMKRDGKIKIEENGSAEKKC